MVIVFRAVVMKVKRRVSGLRRLLSLMNLLLRRHVRR
jgi:hypothetical protein